VNESVVLQVLNFSLDGGEWSDYSSANLTPAEIPSCYLWWEAGIGSHSDLSALLQGTELRVLGRPALGKLLWPLGSDITLYCRKVKTFNIIEDEPKLMRLFEILQKYEYVMKIWAEVNYSHMVVFSVTTSCNPPCTYHEDFNHNVHQKRLYKFQYTRCYNLRALIFIVVRDSSVGLTRGFGHNYSIFYVEPSKTCNRH
jgi:hypothetical protein